MTTLPSRNTLTAIGQTYGQVRTALGDLRDFLEESLGTSGTTPIINDASLQGVSSLGVRTSTPGADVQINGAVAITSTAAASPNPGEGNLYLEKTLKFNSSFGTKLEFPATSGNALALGRQPDMLYLRTKSAGAIAFYEGGVHSDTALDPGSGGTELFRISPTEIKYKGNDIYHSGNGFFLRKDAPDTAAGEITFNAGASIPNSTLTLSSASGAGTLTASKLHWKAAKPGARMIFNADADTYSLGMQATNLYLRTAGSFSIFRNGTHSDTDLAPGSGGEVLFSASSSALTYRGQNIYHSGNVNFVEKVSANRPGVDRIYEAADTSGHMRLFYNKYGDGRFGLSSYGSGGTLIDTRVDYATNAYGADVRRVNGKPLVYEETGNRPGVVKFYVLSHDTSMFVYGDWDSGNRIYLNSSPNKEIWSDGSAYADTAGRANSIHGNNIDDGTVRFYELSRGQGSVSNVSKWAVNQFAFASPYIDYGANDIRFTAMGSNAGAGQHRVWGLVNDGVSSAAGNNNFCTWDYITGSGFPYTWAVVDTQGNIVGTWDSEDPADREFPDKSPILDTDSTIVKLPQLDKLEPLLKLLDSANIPDWVAQSKYKDCNSPEALFKAILKDYSRGRYNDYYKEGNDKRLEDFVYCIDDPIKRNWRIQAILRALARATQNIYNASLASFASDIFKLDRNNNTELK